MKRIIIDTDILVDFFHAEEYARILIPKMLSEGSIYISILTITELLSGFNEKQAKEYLPKLYNFSEIINLSVEIAEVAGKLRYFYRTKGKILSAVDALIAASAIKENCLLATRNKRDYPMKELQLYNLKT